MRRHTRRPERLHEAVEAPRGLLAVPERRQLLQGAGLRKHRPTSGHEPQNPGGSAGTAHPAATVSSFGASRRPPRSQEGPLNGPRRPREAASTAVGGLQRGAERPKSAGVAASGAGSRTAWVSAADAACTNGARRTPLKTRSTTGHGPASVRYRHRRLERSRWPYPARLRHDDRPPFSVPRTRLPARSTTGRALARETVRKTPSIGSTGSGRSDGWLPGGTRQRPVRSGGAAGRRVSPPERCR